METTRHLVRSRIELAAKYYCFPEYIDVPFHILCQFSFELKKIAITRIFEEIFAKVLNIITVINLVITIKLLGKYFQSHHVITIIHDLLHGNSAITRNYGKLPVIYQ